MDEPTPIGPRGILVALGLATPLKRAFVASVLVGIVAFTAGFPKAAFTEEGELRPQRGMTNDPKATNYHFLVSPLSAGLVVFLFT
jgi:hypothetical protein